MSSSSKNVIVNSETLKPTFQAYPRRQRRRKPTASMPADYASTARALALPVDEDDDPASPSLQQPRPAWQRNNSQRSRNSHMDPPSSSSSYLHRAYYYSDLLQRRAYSTYRKLSPLQRILLVIAGVIFFVVGILFLIFNERIFSWLKPLAVRWRELRGGWLILWIATFLVGFPPMIGYSTCVTLAGFVYGMNGFVPPSLSTCTSANIPSWFIVASATILGSTTSFLASRTLLRTYAERLASDDRFTALALTLKHDGLKVLVMIRLCPLPYSLSNGAIATFPTVSPGLFALATAIATPKLLIHVFIGSRIAAIAGGGEKMDAKTKALNYASITFGILIAVVTGVFVYRQTKKRAAELEAQEGADVEHEGQARARTYSDDEGRGGRGTRDGVGLQERGERDEDDYRDFLSDEEVDDDPFRRGDDEAGDLGAKR